jgi:hypothetical protein
MRCHACQDKSRPAISELMAAIHKRQAIRVSVQAMYDIICEAEEGFRNRVGYDAFRKHVAAHEPQWLRGKTQAAK